MLNFLRLFASIAMEERIIEGRAPHSAPAGGSVEERLADAKMTISSTKLIDELPAKIVGAISGAEEEPRRPAVEVLVHQGSSSTSSTLRTGEVMPQTKGQPELAMQQTQWQKEQQRLQYRRDSLEAVQALAGVVTQVTFLHSMAGLHPGSFLWVCTVLAFTLSVIVGLLVVHERMLMLPAAAAASSHDRAAASADLRSRPRRLPLEMAAITMALSLAFTLLVFAASQLPVNIALSLFLDGRILLPLGAPLLLFTMIFFGFLFSRLSSMMRS